jgi:nucleoside-diphosphate-sugar epimerase
MSDFHTFEKSSGVIEPEPPHVLVMGDLEFLGRHVASAFLDAGFRVSLVTPGKVQPIHNKRLEYIPCDRSDSKSFNEAFSARYFDCTIDLDCGNPNSASQCVEMFFGRTRHHIHLSSDIVYQYDNSIPKPWRESEPIPTPSDLTSPIGLFLSAELVINTAIQSKGFPATIVRSARVTGAYDPTFADYIHMLRILDGKPIVVPEPSGCFRHIHAPDLASVLVNVAKLRHETIGQTINAAGASIVTLNEYLSLLACILGKQITLVNVPLELFCETLPDHAYPFFYANNTIPDITKMETMLGFLPRGFEKFLPRIADWFLHEYKGEVPEAYHSLRDAEAKILESLYQEE